MREAHARGIRIIPDFVANHVQREAPMFRQQVGWYFPYNACDNRWDEARIARIGCWFTTDMPDFDYGANPAAVDQVVDHALWMIQEFDLDGFRADALKHMDDSFVRALKRAVVAEIETTVLDHERTVEPTIFYMVGESLGGWARYPRYHVRPDTQRPRSARSRASSAAAITGDTSVCRRVCSTTSKRAPNRRHSVHSATWASILTRSVVASSLSTRSLSSASTSLQRIPPTSRSIVRSSQCRGQA